MILDHIIYPGLFRSMPHLINETFARNIMDDHFKINNLYPDEGEERLEEHTYYPAKACYHFIIYLGTTSRAFRNEKMLH